MQLSNIVLVVCDALRRGNLGCYGYPCKTSPNIDKFAKKSIVFENCWTVSNKTDPAFTSLETGLYPRHHGIIHHANEITEQELSKVYDLPTIATELSNALWTTLGFDFLGRWHKRGFDFYLGVQENKKKPMSAIEKIREVLNIQPGTTLQKILEKTPLYNLFLSLLFSNQETPYTPADGLVDKAIEAVGGQDNFMFIHFWDTHIPYWPPKKYERDYPYSNMYDDTETKLGDIRKTIQAPLRRFFFDCMMHDKKTVYDCIKAYDGEIRYIDENFGRLMDSLDLNKTMVIFTSDHGESLVENGIYFTHDGFADCVMRTPLIVHYPGCKPERIKRKVNIVDIAPTIFNAVGIRHNCDGRSLI